MATLQITTSQNVLIEYPLANLRERFLARFIDTLIILVVWYIIIQGTSRMSGRFIELLAWSFPIWFTIFYDLYCEIFTNGQTIGKKTQNIRVVRVDGREGHFSDYLLRSVFLLVDLVFSFGSLGYLLIFITPRNQRLGDLAAGTTVLQLSNHYFKLQDILNIHTQIETEIQYPQIKSLTEHDMLLIKTLVIRYRKYPNAAHEAAVRSLYERLCLQLDIEPQAHSIYGIIEVLKTWINDYVALTR